MLFDLTMMVATRKLLLDVQKTRVSLATDSKNLKICLFWVCFLGCPDEIKNYAVTLSLSGKTNEKLSYHGNVHTLDDDFENIIKEEHGTLVVSRKLATRFFMRLLLVKL